MSPHFTFLIVLSSFGFQTLAQNEYYGTAKVGEACSRDYNCIQHAYCRTQLTCFCEPNYLPTSDMSICIPTIGLMCENNEACNLMSNAECRQNICACLYNYTVDIRNSSNCLASPVAVNDPCQRHDQCIDSMDRALCIDDRCQCLTAHHFVKNVGNSNGKCVRTAGLYQGCESDANCFIPGEDEDLLECKQYTCSCRAGKTSKHCSGAHSNSATMAGILIMFFIRFLT